MAGTPHPPKWLSKTRPDRPGQEEVKGTPWGQLNAEARDEYGDHPLPARSRRWTALFVLGTIVLVGSIFGSILRLTQLNQLSPAPPAIMSPAADLGAATGPVATTESLPLSPNPTVEPADLPENNLTATLLPAVPAAGSERLYLPVSAQNSLAGEVYPDTGAGSVSLDPNRAAAAATQASLCLDRQNFAFLVVKGPDLTPGLGTVYIRGDPSPEIRAGWILENRGKCDWKQVLLLVPDDLEMLNPILQQSGQQVNLGAYSQQVIRPGEKIELWVDFSPEESFAVDREYVLVVNGLSLFDQPHLALEVKDWIISKEPTSTVAAPTYQAPVYPGYTPQPTAGGSGSPGSRPTEQPPDSRP